MEHVLLAVADTAASLAAARAAVSLAARLGAELRVIHVVPDGELAAAIGAGRHRPYPTEDRDPAASPLLRHVAASAERAGVPVSTVRHEGDVCTRVLAEADSWPADLIVIGRRARRGAGEPFMGVEAQRMLEFAGRPVLVVPH
jgi:nucleotide-binding universal stress UspA family protein